MATVMDSPKTHVEPVGLTLLSDPLEAVIDIVFVHGLQGHPRRTWTVDSKSARKSSAQALSPSSKVSESDKARARSPFRFLSKHKRTESGCSDKEVEVDEADGKEEVQGKTVFWPEDLLKEDFPRARVMTFGYNTSITQGYYAAHQGNIFSHARDLLYKLEAKRRNAAKRDLVFIAHSLGGILVKEVLRRSEIDPDPKINRIFISTTGVFFFGTPHRGSKDWASFGEGIASVAGRLLGVDTNDKVVHALLPTGPELELCRESFAVQWAEHRERLIVRTFQESKGFMGIQWGGFNQLVVPPESSTLDHPNQRARTIDADHIEMVKFSGKNDRNYEMVRDDIEELVMMAMPYELSASKFTALHENDRDRWSYPTMNYWYREKVDAETGYPQNVKICSDFAGQTIKPVGTTILSSRRISNVLIRGRASGISHGKYQVKWLIWYFSGQAETMEENSVTHRKFLPVDPRNKDLIQEPRHSDPINMFYSVGRARDEMAFMYMPVNVGKYPDVVPFLLKDGFKRQIVDSAKWNTMKGTGWHQFGDDIVDVGLDGKLEFIVSRRFEPQWFGGFSFGGVRLEPIRV